jgi:hypothetical protein
MVDNRGHVRRVIGNKPAAPGKDIQLRADAKTTAHLESDINH